MNKRGVVMSVINRKIPAMVLAWVILGLSVSSEAHASKLVSPPEQKQPVDLVIALDVSGSMDGLIDSAKQRLWDIVNELAQANPQPDLRMAILTYGNPSYGEQSGYVRIDMPFTRDLDAINKTLFSFGTNGGDEYVSRVVHRSVTDLKWTENNDALKILFVAGNEAANQDPLISVDLAAQLATNSGIVVNTIYCGSEDDNIVASWRDFAASTNGLFASINQNAAAVANIATPMDAELARLNNELNSTYVGFGKDGDAYKANQVAQDKNASAMSMPSVVSRTVAKASGLYKNDQWDLLDALESGVALEEMEVEDLPEPMQSLDESERKTYVAELSKKRESVTREIAELGKQRQTYISEERARLSADYTPGLDEAILHGVRELAERKGFEFDEE
jgi:hypothetical protein